VGGGGGHLKGLREEGEGREGREGGRRGKGGGLVPLEPVGLGSIPFVDDGAEVKNVATAGLHVGGGGGNLVEVREEGEGRGEGGGGREGEGREEALILWNLLDLAGGLKRRR
jgi:hypothetical protein